jgi:putative methionine-R-sulfoxide reductase with GAF domain
VKTRTSYTGSAALNMEPEDGCISVLDIDDVSTVAFTAEGVENLKELLKHLGT